MGETPERISMYTRLLHAKLVELGYSGGYLSMQKQFLNDNGWNGNISEMWFRHLRSIGYTGPLSTMWARLNIDDIGPNADGLWHDDQLWDDSELWTEV